MSVGFATTKAEWDTKSASAALDLRNVLARVAIIQSVLAGTADATLVAMGYTAGEVAQLKSAFTDLDKLRAIYEGAATQATAYDFRTFSKLLLGLN